MTLDEGQRKNENPKERKKKQRNLKERQNRRKIKTHERKITKRSREREREKKQQERNKQNIQSPCFMHSNFPSCPFPPMSTKDAFAFASINCCVSQFNWLRNVPVSPPPFPLPLQLHSTSVGAAKLSIIWPIDVRDRGCRQVERVK